MVIVYQDSIVTGRKINEGNPEEFFELHFDEKGGSNNMIHCSKFEGSS